MEFFIFLRFIFLVIIIKQSNAGQSNVNIK